ncbi:UBX domain-containing protein 10 [Trichoplax sp. H2]|uniref:UBX domain-containing protein n=1 Tax=Trichoplax adhaerens TaxID=10228 RepID=B3RZN0_TRIAD|nr:hypothetical protein TRIADDRAFT_57513 [Trichoplax adhaerens]EDV24234.1 hypothetical protein TRIADDRAFT_57513 [Trichoplax adhaerens]RDD39129.1 UBX domain-containing protein 10 [Trichoplax sp. H2]|eukprot:XP_002113760.1 hypothetical protein TRIADDRAFT_57513 [Trichoplax adhaerens]
MSSTRNRPQSAKGRRRPPPTSLPSSPSYHQHSSERTHTAPDNTKSELQSTYVTASSSKPLVRGLSQDSALPNFPPAPESTAASLSKYKRLPSIGNRDTVDIKTVTPIFRPHPPNSNATTSTFKRNHLARRASDPKSWRQIPIPPEPDDQDEDRIMLAVKLNNGKRIERWFRRSNTLNDIIRYAAYAAKSLEVLSLILVTNEIPKREFDNLSMTIAEADIKQRTLLYLQSR